MAAAPKDIILNPAVSYARSHGVQINATQNNMCCSQVGESGSWKRSFSVEAEMKAQKFHPFRFHIGGKNRGRKEIGSAILRRRAKG